MFPSSNRVKLNRVALKDVAVAAPRRRRAPGSPSNVAAQPEEQVQRQDASAPGSDETVRTFLTDRMGPSNKTGDTASRAAEGEPGDDRVGPTKAKRRRNHLQSRRESVDSVELEQEGAYTRDNNKNRHPSPAGLAGSEGSLGRAVTASSCDLCGDCTYTSPPKKTPDKNEQESSSPGPEQSTVGLKINKGNPVTETSKKKIIWIDQYPKVALCDVIQKCDVSTYNCGYVLPEVLKSQVVHCFKRDMRAGFRFAPSCLGHNKQKSEQSAVAKNGKFRPKVQTQDSVCQSPSLTEHQRHRKERADAGILCSRNTHFHRGWIDEASATCSASFSLGKPTNEGDCRTRMWDSDVEGDPGPRCDLIGADFRRDKKIKLGYSLTDGSLPSTLDSESISCSDAAKTHVIDKEKTSSGTSGDSQSCLELASGSCSTNSSRIKENCIHEKSCGQIGEPRETDAAQITSELLCQRNEVDTDGPESFTCQRVRGYCRTIRFSCARTYMSWPFSNTNRSSTAHASTAAHQAEPIHPSARNDGDSPVNRNQSGSPSSQTNDMLPSAPPDESSNTTQQVFHQNEDEQKEDGERAIAKRNGKRHCDTSSYSLDSNNMEFTPHFRDAEESLTSLLSDTATLSPPGQCGGEPGTGTALASSTAVNGPDTDSTASTPPPSVLGLSDWETATAVSPTSSLVTHGGLSTLSVAPSSSKHTINAVEKTLFYCEETKMTSCCSSPTSPSVSSHNCFSFNSCESFLLLPQDEAWGDEEFHAGRSPPILEPYYNVKPFNQNYLAGFGKRSSSSQTSTKEQCVETNSNEYLLPPLLSPVNSPQGHSGTSSLLLSQCCSEEEEEEEEEINKDTSKHEMLPGHHIPQIGNSDRLHLYHHHCEEEEMGGASSKVESLMFHSMVGDVKGGFREESQEETDCEDEEDQGNGNSEQVPFAPKPTAKLISSVLTEPCSSPSSDDGSLSSHRDARLSPSELVGSEWDKTKVEAAGDTEATILDEVTAYEQDILLVDVIQDDPELFENLPEKSLLKLGPARVCEAPKPRPTAVVKVLSPKTEQRLSPVIVDFHSDSPDIKEGSKSRPWRPQCSSNPSTDEHTRHRGPSDANNNLMKGGLERNQPLQMVNSTRNTPLLPYIRNVVAWLFLCSSALCTGPWITKPANVTDCRRQQLNSYCRQYFSESLSCGFKICRFQHVPVDGDEKFCVETVTRFIQNPKCLQKAGAVFTGYYQNNAPGVYFSMPVCLSLLWALLKASMVPEVLSVLGVSLAHKIAPGHEYLLALFNFVRDKALVGCVPELLQLTIKMASAGLVLSLDWLECVKNTPEFQQTIRSNSPLSVPAKLSACAPFPEYLNLAHSIVEIELCTKQEDWRRMGKVFRSICQSSHHPNQVEQVSGRIAIALLSESKDKLSLPFAAFAETVCKSECDGFLLQSFLGRIGVSLMLRYHKTHQWAKGRRVVEVLSVSKVSYSTLKGLFGNEDGASRCVLVTVATELFLLSGSVEGALNTLRENNWFLSSHSWPCEPADLDNRSHVLMRLAEKTSHRDTLEVLCNLPGLKEPNVDQAVLQILLHKLGKQNIWLRAREVFRHSLSVGYYTGVSAPPGFLALIVPCRLWEVELALAFEMFIAVNATDILQHSDSSTSCLSITLKRTQSGEGEYLSAGSRLLSAACVPQPKLNVHYTAVNSSQEQVFTLDISSARRWLRHNHLWANEVWTH
ncbi:uncharacterized protein topaz1 isoform X3 [Scophthalmus maximus]|uniref:uncharacterized protein topaz1 isoform X3 n=1 Tax=Scophthalmus maximus TaxID=52904 RepID=UPI001FA8F968|nr:uncharacterized protein topaz1 isoform X3 [Scophthalmus maximus]